MHNASAEDSPGFVKHVILVQESIPGWDQMLKDCAIYEDGSYKDRSGSSRTLDY
jgi:hypothetical protein